MPTRDDERVIGVIDDSGAGLRVAGNCGDMIRFSGADGRQVQKVRISEVPQELQSVAALGSLWVCDEIRSEVVRIDLSTGRVIARLPVDAADPGDAAFGAVAGEHSVWLVDGDFAAGVLRVDPVQNRVIRLTRPDAPMGTSVVVGPAPG